MMSRAKMNPSSNRWWIYLTSKDNLTMYSLISRRKRVPRRISELKESLNLLCPSPHSWNVQIKQISYWKGVAQISIGKRWASPNCWDITSSCDQWKQRLEIGFSIRWERDKEREKKRERKRRDRFRQSSNLSWFEASLLSQKDLSVTVGLHYKTPGNST